MPLHEDLPYNASVRSSRGTGVAAEMTYATVAVRVMVHGEGARVRTAPVPAAMLALLELLAAAAVLVAAGLPVDIHT